MKKKLCFLISLILISANIKAPYNNSNNAEQVPFSFRERPLIEIIDFIAAKKNVNVILPRDVEQLRKQTVTYQPLDKETLDLETAWNMLHTFLEHSGYSLFKKKDNLYAIIKSEKDPQNPAGISHEPLPLFVATNPNDLPKSEARIRYIAYLRNLKVPTGSDDRANPLTHLIKEMASPNAITIWDPKSNGFVLIDKANVITSMLDIINQLDSTGFKDTITVVPLYNIPVQEALRVFDYLMKATGAEAQRLSPFIRTEDRPESLSYFASDTKIVPDYRNNSLILMGRQSALERLSEFIRDNMDVTAGSGKSILHEYDLQYLDAESFAQTLTKIVATLPPIEGAQAKTGAGVGPERYFQGVIVKAEGMKTITAEQALQGRTPTETVKLETLSTATPGSNIENPGIPSSTTITIGGNRLIIAALQDDWIRIKELIEKLDKPQPQVILEVLIADVTSLVDRILGGDVRNPRNMIPPCGFDFLSSNLSNPANVLGGTPQTLAADLLKLVPAETGPIPITSPTILESGTTIISFNDPATPGIAALIQILDHQMDVKIITHPFLITTNNQKATITDQTLRRTQGDAVPSASGVVTVQIEDVPATIQVQMIPRLSSFERLSLQVAIDVNEFVGSTLTRLTRRANTNANLGSGQILVIGGLTRVTSSDTVVETPLLCRIPIIGYFFKRVRKIVTKTNIAIFISPTIIQPKLRSGLNLYTQDKIRRGRRDIDDYAIFGEDRDPITHIFFRNIRSGDRLIGDYLANTKNVDEIKNIQTSRERKREAQRTAKKATTSAGKLTVNQVIA